MRIEKSVWGSLYGITRLCRVISNTDPERRIFLSAPGNHDRYFFLLTFWYLVFDFTVGVATDESPSYTLTSTILKVEVVCDIEMTSTPNFLITELHDLLYNQCIDNTYSCLFFIYPTDQIRVRKIRFVSTGENHGKPCLVCKKKHFLHTRQEFHCYWPGQGNVVVLHQGV